jgi:hypothetical protein
MATDTALIEKREELKRRLAAGEYKTLVDLVLAGTDSLIRKVSRRSKPLPLWLVTITLSIVYSLINFSGINVLGEWSTYRNFNESYFGYGLSDLQTILLDIFLSVFGIATIVVINQYIGRIFILWQTRVLDATESISSLDEFQYWLAIACNRRLQFLLSIVGGLLLGLYGVAFISTQFGVFVDYGLIFAIISACVLGCPFLYLFLTVVLLAAKLRRYDLKLFAADPSNSELVSYLSGELSFFGYFVAAYAAILTLVTALNRTVASVGIILVLLYWLPIIALFIMNQTSLSSIIQRAKWKTLNEAQAKVEKLRASKSFGSPTTMDAISKLMDYHDRVKATRDSALNSGAILSFINSLLLPLLAFLLGNLDKLMMLLPQRP